MPRINLLPWRERQKREREVRFGVATGSALALMGLLILGVHLFIAGQIDYQNKRNNFLKREIAEMDKKIAEIKNLQTRKEKLLARRKVIEQLESDRNKVVHVFDELVRRLPDGVYFTEMEQKGKKITLKGFAQSDARVASLMNFLTASEWFGVPNVKEIKAQRQNNRQQKQRDLSEFTIEVEQTVPKSQQLSEEGEIGA